MTAMFINPSAGLDQALETEPACITVIEYKRYDEPTEGWVFYVLYQDESGSETPFATFEQQHEAPYEEYVKLLHRGYVDGWMQAQPAEAYRKALKSEEFVTVPWAELPEEFRGYIQGCVLPLEWQSDPELMASRTVVHRKGEWPA